MNNPDQINKELRDSFIIIGLTGSIGSGCTTISNILSTKKEDINIQEIIKNKDIVDDRAYDKLEELRESKISSFYKKNKWKTFYEIKVSSIILAAILSDPKINEIKELNLNKWIKKEKKKEAIKTSKKIIEAITSNDYKNESIETQLKKLNEITREGVKRKNKYYTETFQAVGNELRKTGKIHKKSERIIDIQMQPVFTIAELIRRTIISIRIKNHTNLFTIDALRNIFEIQFFKNRYSAFYLLSVVADENTRTERIRQNFQLKQETIKKIKREEDTDTETHSQNINSCIGLGDIFIKNPDSYPKSNLKYQIIRYIALIRKPGLLTPTTDERNMQIALTARYNSGCISRQVGACISGPSGHVVGIGWNDVQENNTPCLYRSTNELLSNENSFTKYSKYENSAAFKEYIQDTSSELTDKNDPFCFKDIQNRKDAENKIEQLNITKTEHKEKIIKIIKNPTRERALHAEENAFLQASKIGGQSVVGSTLYTTASPCQLCAKKSMQLKVKRIVYIDAYPDISNSQTLNSGPKENWPNIDMFQGVGESAFMRLFKPIIPIKEEIEMQRKYNENHIGVTPSDAV